MPSHSPAAIPVFSRRSRLRFLSAYTTTGIAAITPMTVKSIIGRPTAVESKKLVMTVTSCYKVVFADSTALQRQIQGRWRRCDRINDSI